MVTVPPAECDADMRAPEVELASVRRPRALVGVLAALAATGPLSIDMYVPGFPSMEATLRASNSEIQLTMTAFLAGLLCGQLVIGPISDSLGRRRLLIGAIASFAMCSMLCAVAPNVQLLIAARLLHGASGAGGIVLARAVVTDRFAGTDLPRYIGRLAQVLGVAPVIGPLLGGAVLSIASWRGVFAVLSLFGCLLLLAVLRLVPESLSRERRRPGGLRNAAVSLGSLLGRRVFLGYQLSLGFSAAALFTYVSGSSFVFEGLHGVAPATYSLIFGVNAGGMLSSGVLFGRLALRWRLNTLLSLGLGIAASGAMLQVILVLTVGETFAGTWVTLFVVVVGIGFVGPSVMSIGQSIARDAAGAGSALMGGLQFMLAAAASPIVGFFGQTSSLPMASIMLVALAGSVCSLLVLARPWEGHGEPRS